MRRQPAFPVRRRRAPTDHRHRGDGPTTSTKRVAVGFIGSTMGKCRALETRVAAQDAALGHWARYARMAAEAEPEPSSITALRIRHTADAGEPQQQREAARKREAEEQRAADEQAVADKRAAVAAAREEKRRQAQERREERANRSLECNDGTTSPSCTCGGNWSGCCSHHGGVRG